jgi:hypothetical protein
MEYYSVLKRNELLGKDELKLSLVVDEKTLHKKTIKSNKSIKCRIQN